MFSEEWTLFISIRLIKLMMKLRSKEILINKYRKQIEYLPVLWVSLRILCSNQPRFYGFIRVEHLCPIVRDGFGLYSTTFSVISCTAMMMRTKKNLFNVRQSGQKQKVVKPKTTRKPLKRLVAKKVDSIRFVFDRNKYLNIKWYWM